MKKPASQKHEYKYIVIYSTARISSTEMCLDLALHPCIVCVDELLAHNPTGLTGFDFNMKTALGYETYQDFTKT
eukprot:UN15937